LSYALLRRIAVGSGALTIALTTVLGGVAVADESPATDTPAATSSPATPTSDAPTPSESPTSSSPTTSSSEPTPSTSSSAEPTPSKSAAQPKDEAPAPKLDVTAKFDKSMWVWDEEVTGSITITNTGTGPAKHVSYWGSGYNATFTFTGIPPNSGPVEIGKDLAPGESFVVTAKGTIQDRNNRYVDLFAQVWLDRTQNSINASAYASVIPGRGDVKGTLYFDKNGNGRYDQGEGLAGIRVSASGGTVYHQEPTQTTDSDGHFAYTNIPFGDYGASFDGLTDLVAQYIGWTVGDQPQTVFIEARPKVTDELAASVKLNSNTYAGGDTAHITVTLTNKGDRSLHAVTERCNGIGDANQLSGFSDGWGDLRDGHAGVSVPAHSTITIEVTEQVPVEARDWGYTALSCRFGETGFDEVVADAALASVPGKVIPSVALTLVYDKNSDGNTVPVTGVKVYLTDYVTKKIVASAVSDSAGSATFTSLPAGLYGIGLVGPWKTAGEQATIWPTRMGSVTISVEPGPDQPDPTVNPTNPTTNVPVSPAAQASPALAYTGVADVLGLSLAAGAALVLGVGLVLLSRRRRVN
jgi:hypothetical protein